MPTKGSFNSISILHVDDDEYQLDMMKEFVQAFDKDIIVDSISNPNKVLDRLRSQWYDCLIVDFKMPEMTGIELSKMIRKESIIPIILYTGHGSEEVAEKAFSVGVNDYFRKEITPQHYQVLAKRIRGLVEKQRIERVYTNVITEARDAIAIAVGTELVFVNPALVDLLGESSAQNLLGKNMLSIISSKYTNKVQEDARKLLQGKKSHIIAELEIERKDGKIIPIESSTTVIDYLGQKALLGIVRDLTERRLMEAEIRKSEEKYRSLVNLAPDGIVKVSILGEVNWVNKAFLDITGFSEEEILGKNIFSLQTVRATDIGKYMGFFFDAVRGRPLPPIEFMWVRKDGQVGLAEGRVSLLKLDENKTELLIIARDITQRKKMEEDLKKYSEEMEHLADERAQKLLDSEKMIAAGVVASTVAHDLRGPLSTIRNATYLMGAKPERSAEMKEIIIKAVDNAAKMLNEIKGKTAEEILHFEDVDIASFIGSIIEETPIPPRISIRKNLENVVVGLDKLRLRRVIENLIRNAVDAMPEQGTIYISNKVENEKIIIEVKDTGMGIPKEMMNTLFKPFFTTKTTGTGLGLYYCKKTMDAHGGSIEVKSKVKSGSTFTLKIPLKRIMKENVLTVPIAK